MTKPLNDFRIIKSKHDPYGDGYHYSFYYKDRFIASHFCTNDFWVYADLYRKREVTVVIGDMSLDDFRKIKIIE